MHGVLGRVSATADAVWRTARVVGGRGEQMGGRRTHGAGQAGQGGAARTATAATATAFRVAGDVEEREVGE